VEIEVEGCDDSVESFERCLVELAPPLAHIVSVKSRDTNIRGTCGFSIKESAGDGARVIAAPPDSDVCDDCLRELLDPDDRRYLYPFINCVNCGPRFSIITAVPYDRPNTTMSGFQMCADCRAEYDNPENRRFHAQPIACHVCGPKLSLRANDFSVIDCGNPVIQTIRLLAGGKIVAIKGIGGYHLAVNAADEKAVAELRARKRRDEKPFAVMFAGMESLRRHAKISEREEALLKSRPRPITLLGKLDMNSLTGVAPENRFIGAMLPYSPLQHLLFHEAPFDSLVMTSANLSDEPIVSAEDEAAANLQSVADYFLTHDRPIHNRSDDSIEKVMAHGPVVMRRSRGYTPTPIMLDREYPDVLAVGAELKNTFCVIKGDRAYLSAHMGDLKYESAMESFRASVERMLDILGAKPEAVAYDLHPGYMSSAYAKEFGAKHKIGVQHHHAHMASLLAERHFMGDGIGIVFDGTGYGEDGTIWGGEFFVGGVGGVKRLGTVRPIPLIGGDAAVKEPFRIAIGALFDAYYDNLPKLPQWIEKEANGKIDVFRQMWKRGVNTHMSSGMGRLFDAVSAIAGVRLVSSFEGQAAMELEMAVANGGYGSYPFTISEAGDMSVIDFLPALAAINDEAIGGADKGIIAAKFHETVALAAFQMAVSIRTETGLDNIFLSGGVFQNSTLSDRLGLLLADGGFSVHRHGRVPPNDGGIALGQALITARTIG